MQLDPALHDALIELLTGRLEGPVPAAELVDWATNALEAGLESGSLILLAGLARGCSMYEAAPLLDRALTELELPVPVGDDLRRAYVGVVSRGLLAGKLDVRDALDRIHRRVVTPLGHPPDLAPWCFVWEGLHPDDYRTLDDDEIASEARRLATTWTAPSHQRDG